MITEKFELNVSYSQLSVFIGSLASPFNDWEASHVTQGFSWREGSVSFRTLSDSAPIVVEVRKANTLPSPKGIRAILVPFHVSSGETVVVASIAEEVKTCVESGIYQLLFEIGKRDNSGDWCRLTFVPSDSIEPEILIADHSVIRPARFLMKATPA